MAEELKVGDVPVTVVRKGIKHLHLYVRPPDGRVLVTGPEDMSDQSALLFVRENFGWVLRQREGMLKQRRQTPREYVDGETHYLWGQQYFLRVETQKEWGGIRISGNEMLMLAPDGSTVRSRAAYMAEWYRSQLVEAVRAELPRWEKATGLAAERFEIREMSRSWGLCDESKRKLTFNLQLARKPREGLNYVILHELCHIAVRSHGRDFVALIDRFMPNWREVRMRLNEAPLDFTIGDQPENKV
jgi:hypothetical protein